MFAIDEEQDQGGALRMARLEARVKALEEALARVLGAESPAPAASHFANTQKLPTLETAAQPECAAPAARSDSLGITAAFAQLDTRVAEAAEAESALLRKPDLGPLVPIDPGLIEDRFAPNALTARPKVPTRALVRSDLETGHPKILNRLQITWRSRECVDYLNSLIVCDRGDRVGFDPAVMSELLTLSEILEAADNGDAWAANARAI